MYKCHVCNAGFDFKSEVDSHVLSTHTEKMKCDICDFRSVSKQKLWKHVSKVHEKKKKPLNIHGKASAAKRMSSSFKSVHEKIKPFKCHTCEMGFLAKKNLYRHIATDHERKKITKKICIV